jgi:phospholipid/cholesterol/gamma-HCH transport system substrate-binding protein
MRWVLATLLLLLGACDVPLPGGAPSGPSYAVKAEFADVLDLVPQAAVKVNDVTVGSVEHIALHGFVAVVTLRVDREVSLPDNATAAIRQSSLLGEKFVALDNPVGESPQGTLGDGDTIPLERTRRGAEVEEVLAALGLLLNGGGLAQLKTINEEAVKALAGREADAKAALHQLDAFVTGLDEQKADIVKAIEALDRLSADLASQRDTIGKAVEALAPGLTVLAQQREQLTTALTALKDLSTVGVRVIEASKEDTVASLRALQPILDNLVKAGDALPKGLDFALTYPFPPNVQKAITGDFVRLHVTADLDATTILSNLAASAAGGLLPPINLPPLPQLPPLPLPSLPPLPPLPLPTLTITPLPTILPSGLLPLPPAAPIRVGVDNPSTGEVVLVQGGFDALLYGGQSA